MICPNLSDPTIRKQFSELESAVGEAIAYYLWDKNQGYPLDLNPDGTPSELFNQMLELSGDRKKTIQALALTFSNKYKQFKPTTNVQTAQTTKNNEPIYQEDIDRVLAEREQLKQITKDTTELDRLVNFIYENELTDLDLAARQYFKLAASKTFPKALKRVSEEQAKAIKAEVKQQRQFRKETQLSPREEAEALLWYKNHPLSKVLSLKALTRVVNQYGFASFTKKAITLYKHSSYTDLYHEAWHGFTQMFLSPAERDVLYAEVKKLIGEYKGISFQDLTRKEIEEYLAEGFKQYAQTYKEKETPKPKNFVEKLFNRIWNFLNWLIGKDGKVKPESKSLIQEAYEKLYTGKFVDTHEYKGTPEFDKLYAGTIVGHYLPKINIDWGEEFESKIVNGDYSKFFLKQEEATLEDGIYRLKNDAVIRVVSFPTQGGKNYEVSVIDDYEFTLEETREVYKAFDYFFFEALRNTKVSTPEGEKRATLAHLLSDKDGELKTKIYEYIQSNLAVLYEEKKENYLKVADTEEAEYSSEREQFLSVFAMLNNFESFAHLHFKYLKDIVVEVKDDVYEVEGEARNREDWAVELGDIDPVDNADPLIYTLIKGLPDLTDSYVDGKPLVNRGRVLGLPQTGDFNRNWNILIDTLGSTSDYNTMVSKLQELSKTFTQFAYFLDQLPKSVEAAETLEDLKIITALTQSVGFEFSPYGLSVKQKKSNDGKPGFELNLHELATTAAKKVQDFLDTDFMHNEDRKYRKLSKDEYVLDLQPILEDYYELFRTVVTGAPVKIRMKTVLDFYDEVFGMNFKPFVEDADFNKITAKLNSVFIETYKRVYLFSKDSEYANNIKRPFGLLTRNFSPDVLRQLQEAFAKDGGIPKEFEVGNKKKQIGTIVNFSNDRNDLFKYYDKYYRLFGDKSFINQELNMQYAMVPYNEIFYQVERLNAAQTVDDLAGHLQTSHLVTSTFSNYSNWIGRLFKEDGTKTKNNQGVPVTLKPINWAGPTVVRENSTYGKGKKVSNLQASEKFVNDFFSFIKGNVFENIRFGEKNTSMALTFRGSKQEVIAFAEETFLTSEGYFSPEFETQLLNYLAYELEMYFNAPKAKDKRFIIFQDLLSADLKKEILETVEPLYNTTNARNKTKFQKGSEARKAIFNPGKDKLRNKIIEEAQKYFKKEVFNEWEALGFALIPNAASYDTTELKKAVGMKLAEILNVPFDSEFVHRKILYYIANYFVHQIELTHLFVANPRNYQKTEKTGNFREGFKRFGLTSSPGRQARLSPGWLETYNKFKSRELATIASQQKGVSFKDDSSIYTDKIRMTVANDVFTNENNSETVIAYYKIQIANEREALGKKKLSDAKLTKEAQKRYEDYTKQSKESDAQAWGNLDFIRMYLDSIRRWTPAHEAAYEAEKAILSKFIAYKNETDTKKKLELWNTIQEMRYGMTVGQIPSLKLGLYGSALGFPDSKTAGKFSVHTLLPSVVIGTDLETVMLNMYETKVDLFTFQSGSKLDFPAEVMDLYSKDKDTMRVNSIGESNVATFSIESLREQQYIAPKFKNESTLGTQFTKLIFGDFYDGGDFSDDFPEEVRNLVEQAQKDFKNTLTTLIDLEKENLAYEAGVTMVNGQITDVNKEVFYKWLKGQGEKRDTAEDFINFAIDAYSYGYDLDAVGFRNFVESVLTSTINKRLIRPKISGEPYIQTASTAYGLKNKRFTNATVDQLLEYGTNGLRDYRIEDGETQPADCKIAFNPKKHAGLLELEWKGSKIYSVKRLNEALLDDEWVKQHSDKLILIGVRIPTQNFNSMEYFRVREFLPTAAGAVMIVPPSIVTKSGSDFDIDKLFMYEPNIDENGNLINAPIVSKAEHSRDLAYYKEQINEINGQLEALSEQLINLPEYQHKERLKQSLSEVKIPEVKTELPVTNKKSKKGVSLEELQSEYQQRVTNTQKEYLAQIADIHRQIKAVKEGSPVMMDLYVAIENLKYLKDEWYKARDLSQTKVEHGIATLYNSVINTSKKVLAHPALFEVLTKPNNNNILVPTIEKFYKRLGKPMDSPVSGTKMYLPAASTLIHKDTLESKKALGIVAKMNALHKLYQQTGLKWKDPFYNLYFLDDVAVENKVVLGGKYSKRKDENGNRVLVSDLLSQFVNGHVDIGKEDWINRIRSDQQRAPIYMQMLIQRTSLDTSIIFMLQPVLNEYFNTVSSNLFQEILFPSTKRQTDEAVLETMLLELLKVVDPSLIAEDIKDTVSNVLSFTQDYRNFLKNIDFEESFEKYPISVDFTKETKYSKALAEKNIPYLKTQLAFLAQFYVLRKQNEALVTLNQHVDFNTVNYSTLQEMYEHYNFLSEGLIEGGPLTEVFDDSGLNKVLEDSVLTPFNTSRFGVDLYSNFYAVTGNARYLKALREHYIAEEKDIYGFEFLSRYVNKFNNDFILSIFQNAIQDGDSIMRFYQKDLFEKTGLPQMLEKFKKNTSPEMGSLFERNNFLKYLRFRKIEGTEYYYPALAVGSSSKESKDDFVAQLISLSNAKFSDLELEEEFGNFVQWVTVGTLIQKGFIAKLNTIQPFISYKFFSPTLNSALTGFQTILNDEVKFKTYFTNFVKQFEAMEKENFGGIPHFKDFTGNLPVPTEPGQLIEAPEVVAEVQQAISVKKIISGGQTGVDRMGLEVGKETGLQTGGTAPPGFVTESGKDLTLKDFGVEEIRVELQSGKSGKEFYLPRTEQNVLNSDGTVYFATSKDSAGKIATEKFAKKHNKPFLLNPTVEQLRSWLVANNIETLNVAGNRGSKLSTKKAEEIKNIIKQALSQPTLLKETEQKETPVCNTAPPI